MLELFLTRQLIYGAAAAAMMGLGLGAWMTPPTMARDADPYAQVAFHLPQDEPYADYSLPSSGWSASDMIALPLTPATWPLEMSEMEALPQTQELAVDKASLELEEAPQQVPAALTAPEPTEVEAMAYHRPERWPSRTGDVLQLSAAEPALPAPVEATPVEAPEAEAVIDG